MSVLQFFRRSRTASPTPTTASSPTSINESSKSSLELFADYVGDGHSPRDYEFPPLDILEFDAKPYDSFEILDNQAEELVIFDRPSTARSEEVCPYESNVDLDAELRAEIALFSRPVHDRFEPAVPTMNKW